MAGLVPAIHVLLKCWSKKGVDARHEAGHDEREATLMSTRQIGVI
jgi:hypothetical protein